MVLKQKLSRGCIILLNVKLDHKHLAKAHREYILKKYNESTRVTLTVLCTDPSSINNDAITGIWLNEGDGLSEY